MPNIDTLRPVTRQQGTQIPNLLPASRWIDAQALGAGVAETYTIPTDSDGHKGAILGISATAGPLYASFTGVAAANAVDIANGTGSIMMRTDSGGSYLLMVPQGATTLSLFCAAACVVTIEVWR